MSGSAASLITASLETAGFIAQAEFLDSFEPFFHSAGALLAVITGISAVVSMVLFANYKMARYLLLGPSIYWFLIGARADIQETIWRLGSEGTARSINQPTTESAAGSTIRALVQNGSNSNLLAAQSDKVQPSDPIRVSAVFKTYIDTIDGIVSNFVSVIIGLQDDKMLLNLGRAKMLESVLNSRSDNPEYMKMLNNDFMTGCHPYIGGLNQYSGHRNSQEWIKNLKADRDKYPANSEGWNVLDERIKMNQDVIDRSKLQLELYRLDKVNPSKQLVDYLRRNRTDSYLTSALQKHVAINPQLANLASGGEIDGSTPLTCGAIWEVIKHATLKEAKWFKEKLDLKHVPAELGGAINGEGQGTEAREKAEEQLCQAIKDKLGKEDFIGGVVDEVGVYGCDLSRLAMVMMLRNAITGSERSQTINRIKNQEQLPSSVESQAYAVGDPDSALWEYVPELSNPDKRVPVVYSQGKKQWTQEAEVGMFRKKGSGELREMNLARTDKELGPFQTAYVEQQRAKTRNLRQRIYAFALQLPYWQGVGLYMLAALYPVVCLVVIIPGRAVGMVTYALTWLWLKSWDIGFAAVMLLDSVLWNLFPNVDYTQDYAKKPFENVKFEDVVGEALTVDPAYNLHAYYMMVSMALFAIPGITAAVILKGKKSVVSSFGDGAKSAAIDAGSRPEGAYSANISQRNYGREQTQIDSASAPQRLGFYNNAWETLKTSNDASLIGMSAGASGLKALSAERAKGENGLLEGALGGIAGGIAGAQKLFNDDIARRTAYNAVFNPYFGRWSRTVKAMESTANAIDPGGGYEIAARMPPRDSLLAAEATLYKDQFSILQNSFSNLLEAAGSELKKAKPLKDVASPAAHLQLPVVGTTAILGTQDATLAPYGEYITESLKSWIGEAPADGNMARFFGLSRDMFDANLKVIKEGKDYANYWESNPHIADKGIRALDSRNDIGRKPDPDGKIRVFNVIGGRFGEHGEIVGATDPLTVAQGKMPGFGRRKEK